METARSLQRGRRNQIAAGAMLVVIGLVALALQYFEGPGRAAVLLVASGVFLASYFYTDVYVLLVPGALLGGLGLGSLAEFWGLSLRDPNAVGLGAGFAMIYLIERAYRRRAHGWPWIPAVLLIASGLGARFADAGRILWRFAPAILVVVGVVIVIRALRRPVSLSTTSPRSL